MPMYYIASQGQQLGPYTAQEVEVQLENEKINWHDYVYDEKNQDWVLLMEHSSFAEVFNRIFSSPIKSNVKNLHDKDPLKIRQWFVLKQNNNYGPFSKVEIIQMLQSKTLQEYDFIWHEGMSAWKRLSEINEFSVADIKALFEKSQNQKNSVIKSAFYRRKFPRSKVNSQAIIHDKHKVYKSVGVEISEGGAGLFVDNAEFELNQQVYLHFKPADGVPSFNAICIVVSKKENVYGVKFLKISAAAKISIATYTNKKAV